MLNNFLNAGDVLSVTSTFSENVLVTGTPRLTLVVGSDNRTAPYTSGDNSTALVFTYAIQAGDNDTDGISFEANVLALNGGTIGDPAGNTATLTHSSVSDNASYKVDTTAPTVTTFSISDTELLSGDNATVTLVFSEVVASFSSSADISDPNGTLTTMTSSDNITWAGTFTPDNNIADMTNTLTLGTNYTDTAGNAGPAKTTENYKIDTQVPTVSGIVISSAIGIQNSFLNEGDNISVTATFSENVLVTGTPQLAMAVGSDNRTATYTSGDNSTTLVFTFAIQAGETDVDGISIGDNALALNSGTISDALGNTAILTHSAVPANTGYKVDTTPPTVRSVGITSGTYMKNNFLNAYGANWYDSIYGDVVSATVTFSEYSIVTNFPRLTLTVGEDNHTAKYTSTGSGTTNKIFNYTIQAGDNDTDGISIGANVISLNSGSISDPAGNNATLTHSAVSDNNSFMVDTESPTVISFTNSETLLLVGDNMSVNLDFSEAVIDFSTADINYDNATGTILSLDSTDNITWAGTFIPTHNRDVLVNTLSVVGGTKYTDLAGNIGSTATTSSYKVDTIAPSGTITFSDPYLSSNETTTVTLVFNEVAVDFSSANDIEIPNLDNGTTSGVLSVMTSSDNITWTGTFTPTFPKTQDWTNTLTIRPDSYTDVDNNTGTLIESENFMIDDIPPSTNGVPTITLNSTLLLWGQSAPLTVVFPEPVTRSCSNSGQCSHNFDNSDIILDNATGTLSTMTVSSNDNTTWTGTFTPTTSKEVTSNTITLAATWTDQVGNPGLSATTSSFEVETLKPYASFTFSDTTGTPYGGYEGLKSGDNATVSLVFNEKVVNFSSADISNSYVDISNLTSSDNITWNGSFTPKDNINHQITRLQTYTSYNDIKGNSGLTAYTNYFYVDSRPPTVSTLGLTDGVINTTTYTDYCLPVTGGIRVTFDYIMEPNYITTSTSDTNCAGTILVSSDNFSSCVRMSSEPGGSGSGSNTIFTLNPLNNLAYDTTYKVRVKAGSSGVKDSLGNNMSIDYDPLPGFKTSSYPTSSPTSGVFVGVGEKGKTVRSIDDGSSWDNESCQIMTDLNGVTYGNNTFVAVGDRRNGYGTVLRSIDNASSFSEVSGYTSSENNAITFGNNTFVAVSNSGRTGRSPNDGSSFTYKSSNQSYNLEGVAFGNNTFIGVISNSYYYYRGIVKSVNDGLSWTHNRNTPSPYRLLYGVAFGNNKFVAVGSRGKILISTNNGTNWSNSTSGTSNNLTGVSFGNNTFVAVGSGGKILRSTDNGANWSNSTSGTSNQLNGVTFGNNTFVAVGSGGKILRSNDDGSSWNNVTSPITTDLNGVTFGE